MDNLKSRAKTAFIWDFMGKLARSGMGFIVSIFLARLLEPSEFGLIAMVTVLIAMADIFTDIGLGGALIQRRRVLPVHYSSVFYFNLLVASLLTMIVYFSAEKIALFYHNEQLVLLTKVLAFTFIISAFSSLQTIKLRKELGHKLITKITLVASLIGGVVGVSLAFYGAGVWSLVVQGFVQGIGYNLIIWNRAKWKPTLQFSLKALLQLWAFGFRMFLTGLIDNIFTRLDYMVIGKLFDATSLGFYQRGKALNLFVIQYSSESLMSILFPALSLVQNNLPRFQSIVMKSYGIISFVTFLLLGGMFVISEELIVLLFGPKWLPSVHFFEILVLSGFVRPMGALMMNILLSRGRSKVVLKMALYKVTIALLNFVVLYLWGMDAFLYGLIVVGIWDIGINIYFASKEIVLPMHYFIKPFVVQYAIGIVAVVMTEWLLGGVDQALFVLLVLKGSLFTILYIGLNYLLKSDSFELFMVQVRPLLAKKRGGDL